MIKKLKQTGAKRETNRRERMDMFSSWKKGRATSSFYLDGNIKTKKK
jgi:hypothetical protein